VIKKDEQWKNIYLGIKPSEKKDKPSRYTFGDKTASSRFKKEEFTHSSLFFVHYILILTIFLRPMMLSND
jgi:hypothetical protein